MFGSQLQKLEKESLKAVSVFQKATLGLETVNKEVEKEIATKSQKVAELESEVDELTVLRAANNRVLEKVQALLG